MTVAKQTWILLLYSALACLCFHPYLCRAKVPLYIGGFFPLNDSAGELDVIGPIARDCLASAQMAIDHINSNDDVLQGYDLDLIVLNTENSVGLAFRKLFDLLNSDKKVIMLLGNFASKITEDLAKATPFWNLMQVSYGSHSVALANRKLYTLFFRTIPSSAGFNFPRVRVILEFNWKNVATIHSTEETFQGATEHLHMLLEEKNISVIASETFTQDPTDRLKFLKEKDARIIIGNFYRPHAYLMFCEAYKLNMFGPDYVWMLYGYDPLRFDDITEEVEEMMGCTKENIMEAAEGTWTINWEIMSSANRTTIGGITPEEYRHELISKTGQTIGVERRPGPFAYDAIWAMAMALNASVDDIKPRRLEDFDYDATGMNMSYTFMNNMKKTDFFGISGPVSFYEVGDRKGVLKVQQMRNGTDVLVGRYYAQTDSIEWLMTAEEIWYRSGGLPPSDKDEMVHQIQQISLLLYITITVLAALGIVMAVGLLAFNIYYRNERLIKMSSPNLNNVIIVGCILTYVTIALLGIDRNILQNDSQLAILCQVRVWILAIGFTLSFGAMFSKTWRVYTIFTNKTLQKRVIKDHRLLAMVGGMLCIDFAILSIWQAVDHLEVHVRKDRPMESRDEENVMIVREIHHCWSQYNAYFTAAMLVFKGLLLIFGAFITWQTRNVSIPALNDSKYIALCIYNVFIFSVIGVPLSFILTDNLDSAYAIIGGFILFCTTGTLCLLFIPKIISIFRGYSPEKVGTGIKATTLANTRNASASNSSSKRTPKTRSSYVDPPSTSYDKRQSLTVPGNGGRRGSYNSDLSSIDKRGPAQVPTATPKMALLVSTGDAANGGSAENIL